MILDHDSISACSVCDKGIGHKDDMWTSTRADGIKLCSDKECQLLLKNSPSLVKIKAIQKSQCRICLLPIEEEDDMWTDRPENPRSTDAFNVCCRQSCEVIRSATSQGGFNKATVNGLREDDHVKCEKCQRQGCKTCIGKLTGHLWCNQCRSSSSSSFPSFPTRATAIQKESEFSGKLRVLVCRDLEEASTMLQVKLAHIENLEQRLLAIVKEGENIMELHQEQLDALTNNDPTNKRAARSLKDENSRKNKENNVEKEKVMRELKACRKDVAELRGLCAIDTNDLYVVDSTPRLAFVKMASSLPKTFPGFPEEVPVHQGVASVFTRSSGGGGSSEEKPVLLMKIVFDAFIDDGNENNPNRGRMHIRYISGGPFLTSRTGVIRGVEGRTRCFQLILACFMRAAGEVLGTRSFHLFSCTARKWCDWLLIFRGPFCGNGGPHREKKLRMWYIELIQLSPYLTRFNTTTTCESKNKPHPTNFLRDQTYGRRSFLEDLKRRPCFGENDCNTYNERVTTGEALTDEDYKAEVNAFKENKSSLFEVHFTKDVAPIDLLPHDPVAAAKWREKFDKRRVAYSYSSNPAVMEPEKYKQAYLDGGYSFYTLKDVFLASQFDLELMLGVGCTTAN